MSKPNYVFMDLGDHASVGGSLMVAHLFAKSVDKKCLFITKEKFLDKNYQLPMVEMVAVDSLEDVVDFYADYLVIDFTEPGKGVSQTALFFQETYNFYLQQDVSYSHNSFYEKIEYVETITRQEGVLQHLQLHPQTPVLTFSAEMASVLNLKGIPTIELCYRFKKPGSFLPGSVIIFGETFSLLKKDEIQLIFEFYQNGKIDDLFLNKNVLEVDWDILYYKLDRKSQSIFTKKYPVSLTESFLDHFLKGFLSNQTGRTFSIEKLMEISQQMDAIDVEMTLDFLKRTLQRCLVDIERKNYPFTQSHWNWVRPYVDCYSKTKFQSLKETLQQALLGLDMYLKIQDRQRRVIGLH